MKLFASKTFLLLSSSYFWYFAVLGLVVPFIGLFLDGKGFNSVEIGEILAMFTITRILGPFLWAMLADKHGRQIGIIRFGALSALISYCFIFWSDSYWPVALVLSAFSLFWSAILPQLEVMTLTTIKRSAKIYSRIRLWGSIGFIVCAVLGGKLIELYGSEFFAQIGVAILIGLLLSTLPLKQPKVSALATKKLSSIGSKLMAPAFVVFFIAGVLLQISFGPFYGFFALFLKDLGYSGTSVGMFIAVGVIAEIFIFIYAGKLLQLFSLKSVFLFCFLTTALRWYLTGNYGESFTLLVISQIIHAFSFGLYHCAGIYFIQQFFDANQQSRGQAVYIGGVYGGGGVIGAYLAGQLWLDGQGAINTFNTAAILALVGGLVFLFFKPDSRIT